MAQVTPYDRPAAATRVLRGDRADAAVEGRGGRWISKLVDPASTLITKGATRLFTSVLRKRLGAPPAEESPVASFEPRGAVPDVCDDNPMPEVQKQASGYRADSRNHSYGDGISELEQLLKQKTFTRAEYNHLMDLLHSRTVDVPKEDENKKIESSTLLPVDDHKKKEDENLPQESRIESSRFIGITLTPDPTLKIPVDELASPAEVAKAYMGSRSSKVSPSSLCLRSQMFREATGSPNFIGFAPKSSAAPICSKSVVCFSGVPGTLGDGYVTPRPQGRSAIYKMSCSPYFKGQPTITLKDGEPIEGGYTGPSVSTQTPMNVPLSSGKQVLKWHSVFESDLGSLGPIRKVRQKSNLVSSSEDVISQHPGKLFSTENALDIVQRSSSSLQRPLPLLERKYATSNLRKGGNQGERSGYASTPLQSREMAEKILQQLDKLVPSLKGQSTEAKTITRDESPPKLTLDMLDGQALKSVPKIDSSQLFSVEANGKLEDSNNFHAASPRSSISPMKGKTENGYSMSTFSEMKMATEGKGVGSFASIAETRPEMESVDSVLLHSTVGPQQKMLAFKMQAPEESLEEVDGSYSGRDISGPSPPGKEKVEVNEHKSVISETAVIKKTVGSNIQSSQVAGKGNYDGPAVADKASGFTFQVSLPLSSQCQAPMTPTMTSLSVEEPVPSSGQNSVPLFTFGSKSSPLIFSSSMMSSSDPAGQKHGANTDFKGQLFGSSSTTESTTIAPVECTKSGEAGKTQMAGYLLKSVGTLSSFGLPMSPSSGSSQFVASGTSSQSNGSLTSNSSIFPVSFVSAAFPSGSSASAIVSTGLPTVSSSSSEPSGPPAFSVLPSLQFGDSSSAVFTNSALPVVKPVSTGLEPKLIKDSPFGNASSSAAVSPIFASTGSSVSGFSASASSGASGCTVLLFGSEAAQSGSATSFAESTISQFSSAASPTFGLASSSFGFSSSVFGKPFGPGSGFGPSSALSSPAGACFGTPSSSSSTSTVIAASVFASSSQSSLSSILNSGFGLSASPSVFPFGASSTASAITSFGSSSMSPVSVSSSAATMPSVFSFTQATATSSSAFSFMSGANRTSATLSPAVSGSAETDQMNVEDSMADDMVQAPAPAIPTSGQPSSAAASSLPFSAIPRTSEAPVFQFASSQPSAFPPSQTPLQASGSFELGGNFSMGSGGGEKSGRRFIKARRDKHRKK